MALTADQIAAMLGGGKSVAPQNWRKTMLAILKNPSVLQSLQTEARDMDESLYQFDPTESYDPSAMNTVVQRYQMQGEKYKPFVDEYFATLAKTGGSPEFTEYNNYLTENADAEAARFGLDRSEFDDLKNSMEKEQKAFLSQQAQVQQKNMAEFMKKRKAAGATGTSGKVAGSYLRKKTGISGLEDVSLMDPLEYVKDKFTQQFGKVRAEELMTKYNVKQQVNKSKFNPLVYGLAKAVKKTVSGQ